MLGYDRPLKPEWIYKTLKLVVPGQKPEEFYEAYNNNGKGWPQKNTDRIVPHIHLRLSGKTIYY
jgi:hypothetical protein